MKIAFIGLGIMGKPMAKNLIKAGHELFVFDRNPAANEEMKAAGANICASSADTVKNVDLVITMLPNSPQVKSVMLEEDKLDLILDISSPDTINYESELLVKESFVLAIPDSLCPFSDPSQKEEDISATPQIHLPALSAIPFILLSEDHDLGKISRKICETAAFYPNIRCICTSSNTAFSLARRGMGVTFLPEIYARTTSFPNIHFFTPDHFHDTRDICAVYRKNIYHHAQFQALLALLREIVPAIYRVA